MSSVKKRIETKFTNEIETKSKKKRINNVCIFNVPEPNNEDEEINYKQDIQNLRKIFENKVPLQMEDLTDVVRLPPNKTKAKSSNPRPIIMKFKTIEKRNEILQSRNLILVENDITHNIYVQPDRTKREQEEHKLLRDELKSLREKGEDNIAIRNGKIVYLRTPFRSDPQRFWG